MRIITDYFFLVNAKTNVAVIFGQVRLHFFGFIDLGTEIPQLYEQKMQVLLTPSVLIGTIFNSAFVLGITLKTPSLAQDMLLANVLTSVPKYRRSVEEHLDEGISISTNIN